MRRNAQCCNLLLAMRNPSWLTDKMSKDQHFDNLYQTIKIFQISYRDMIETHVGPYNNNQLKHYRRLTHNNLGFLIAYNHQCVVIVQRTYSPSFLTVEDGTYN